MVRKVMWLVIVTMVVWSVNLWAAPGDLDPTFDTDGMVTTDFGNDNDVGWSVAIQADGKIVVAGEVYNGSNDDFAVARYNIDGSPDAGFGTGGKVVTDFSVSYEHGRSVAIQADGKIVVAGQVYNGSNDDFAVARYNIDGSPDATFGTDGKVVTDFGNDNDVGRSVAIQADGKIVVAGFTADGSNDAFAVVRYNADDGSPDATFGTDGKVVTDFSFGDDHGYSVAIQADGKIVVAGEADRGYDRVFAVVRYNADDGTMDSGFGSGGMVRTDFSGSDAYGRSVAIQADGKIVVAGDVYNGSDWRFAVVRYNADGRTLDAGFGTDGKVTTDFGNGYANAYSVAIQTNGKIVVAGRADNGSHAGFAVARYNANDGTPDATFGTDGKVVTDFDRGDYGQSVAIQADGKIVVAGYAINGSNDDFAVARFEGDPSAEVAGVASVPTLAEWGLIILSLLLAVCACIALYRKKEMTV